MPSGPWGAYIDFTRRVPQAALGASSSTATTGEGQYIDLAQVEAAIHSSRCC
jgi:hypothetical protein